MTFNSPKPNLKKPTLWNIDLRDFLHGLFMAFVGGTLTAIADAISLIQESGVAEGVYEMFTWDHIKAHIAVGILSALAYIVKKISTNSDGKLLKKETK